MTTHTHPQKSPHFENFIFDLEDGQKTRQKALSINAHDLQGHLTVGTSVSTSTRGLL